MIEVRNLTKIYGGSSCFTALNLSLNEDEIISVLGPSGCGKTTLLRTIAGLERPDGGVVEFDGELMNEQQRRELVSMVFQQPVLFPHLNVERNIQLGFPKQTTPAKKSSRIQEMLELIGLKEFGKRNVSTLSGGEAQRVAFARAILIEPRLMLLDEPFSAVDYRQRYELAQQTRRWLKSHNIPAIHVTHDIKEAKIMADRTYTWEDLVNHSHQQEGEK